MQIAAQLWTFRAELTHEPAAVLAWLSGKGVSHVELAGTGRTAPAEFARMLDDHGLSTIAIHQPSLTSGELARILDEIRFHCRLFRCKFACVMSEMPPATTPEYYRRYAAVLSEAAEKLSGDRIRLCYHVYNFDFLPIGTGTEQSGFDILATLPHNVLCFELDTFWMAKAKRYLPEFVATLKTRAPLIHLNDIDAAGTQRAISRGILPWPKILRAAEELGCHWGIIEHDTKAPKQLFDASLAALRNLLKGE